MTFAERLKIFRGQTGLSQKAFAAEAEIPQLVMNRLETGNRQPDVETLVAIRKRFGANLNELITGERSDNRGQGIPLYEDADLQLPNEERIARRWIVHPDAPDGCYAYRICDNSMFPLLSCNDIVLVMDQMAESGDLVLCRDKTTKIVARWLLCRNKTKIDTECGTEQVKDLVPENEEYAAIPFGSVKIFGRIVATLNLTCYRR